MKKGLSFFAILILIVSLSACGKTKEYTADELADKLKSEITFTSEMNEADEETFSTLYPIKKEDLSEEKTYISTGYTAEEISVVKCSSMEAAARVKQAFEMRVSDQTAAFQNFMPQELTKLQKAVIKIHNNYVILCISDDSEKANKILSEMK